MKITIDTKEDAKEEIMKAIKLLQSIIALEAEGQRNDFSINDNVTGFFDKPDILQGNESTASKIPADKKEKSDDDDEFAGELETY